MNDLKPTSDFLLTGRRAIVTGAGARGEGIGNGRAASVLLARHGAKVALIDREAEPLEGTRRMVEAEGGEAMTIVADVTKPAETAAAVGEVAAAWGGVDVLVNNVGISGPQGTAVDVDVDGWEEGLRVNVTSMMLMAKSVIPLMEAAAKGSIINVASVAGLMGGHPKLLYPTSKGAVVQMTRAMAAQHGREGIRVNCIAPGMVFTPMVIGDGMAEERREERRMRSLLQVEGYGWDVGNAVVFLASDAARWITGVVLPVDAGATAGRHRDP